MSEVIEYYGKFPPVRVGLENHEHVMRLLGEAYVIFSMSDIEKMPEVARWLTQYNIITKLQWVAPITALKSNSILKEG